MSQIIPSGLFVQVGRRRIEVDSYKDASARARTAIEQTGVGVSRAPRVEIVNGAGEVLAYVAYNGRVFKGRSVNWTPETPVLYCPSAEQ